jgi:endonuclease/exonuclease/phosphatase (EEP) superfamily protein YafD
VHPRESRKGSDEVHHPPSETNRARSTWPWFHIVWTFVVLGLLLASLLLAVLRVSDPTALALVALVAVTPLGLPAAVLALLGASFVVRPRGVRAAGVLSATCLVVLHSWWLAPLYMGDHPAARSPSLIVLTQNFEYGDVATLVELVRTRRVDVLVLTDIRTERLDLLLQTGIETLLPYAAGVENHVVHGGAVVFSRVPVTRTSLLSDGAQSRLVEIRGPGIGPLTLVAVHTQPPYSPEAWRADHEHILAALTRIRADPDTAVLLAGDFNATLAHAPVRRILDLGFDDAAAQVNTGWSPTWPSGEHVQRFGVTVPAFAAIDHVMTSPRLVITHADLLTVPAADHKAVIAEIALRR